MMKSDKFRRLFYSYMSLLFMGLRMYTRKFVHIHGLNDFTRFVDYHVSDVFLFVFLCFLGLMIVYPMYVIIYKNIGYIIALFVLLNGFYFDMIMKLDIMDLIMYVIGFILFSGIYYFGERKAKRLECV